MNDFSDLKIDNDTPLWMMPQELREFAAWCTIISPEDREKVRMKIEELSKKDKYKNRE